MSSERPTVIFDAHCGFCRLWIERWKRLTGDAVIYIASPEAESSYPEIPRAELDQSVVLRFPDGGRVLGAAAVFQTLAMGGHGILFDRLYRSSRAFRVLSESAYRVVARNRNFFSRLTAAVFGHEKPSAAYSKAASFFVRALGVIYIFAFWSFGTQLRALIGINGILPAERFLTSIREVIPGATRFWAVPTLAWISAGDTFLLGLVFAGVVGGLLAVADRFAKLGLIIAFVAYLSLVAVGQDFLSFQWDALLIEAGFLALFIPARHERLKLAFDRPILVWCFRLLLFRLMFSSGLVKLIVDQNHAWRSLTALAYHFETQPLPNPISWYVQHVPALAQSLMTALVLIVELAAPVLIFFGRRCRYAAGISLLALQLVIALTGNYAFFNLLTAALCLFLFDDSVFERRTPHPEGASDISLRSRMSLSRELMVISLLSIWTISGVTVFAGSAGIRAPKVCREVSGVVRPFLITNGYGLFATMTTERDELEIEASTDGREWKPYLFRYKPGPLDRPPPVIAPFQPRLDWQMWFAALDPSGAEWLPELIHQLLVGQPEVESLFEEVPFTKPRYLRVRLFKYSFTVGGADWWRRELIKEVLPPVSLSDFESPTKD